MTSTLANPLATPAQLSASSSSLDGLPLSLENSIRYAGASLTQAAGVLLRLPQDIIAQAIVIFTRFWVGPEGGSFREYGASDISAASLYLMAKLSAHPKSPRSVLNVYAYLSATCHSIAPRSAVDTEDRPDATSYYISEATYTARRATLHKHETLLLRALGFQLHLSLPHPLCINYLQTLDAFSIQTPSSSSSQPLGSAVAKRAFAHLNTLLLSPQLVYLTHQPPAIATAAIYLAAREIGLKLPETEWWEVFDTERGDLGFLVVAALSMEGWVRREVEESTQRGRRVPLTVAEVEFELKRQDEDVVGSDG